MNRLTCFNRVCRLTVILVGLGSAFACATQTRGVVPAGTSEPDKFLRATIKGQPITVYGDGEQTRDFTFVEDAVTATVAAATRGVPGRVYNIGGGSRVTVNHVLEVIAKVAGRPPIVTVEHAQKGDMRHTYADTSLAQTDLGFRPTVGLEEGIAAEYRWLSGVL